MATLEAERTIVLDDNARAFITTFIAHAAAIIGADQGSIGTIARIEALLITALAGDANAWNRLYGTIAQIVLKQNAARHTRDAYAYLQSFVKENGDLAHD